MSKSRTDEQRRRRRQFWGIFGALVVVLAAGVVFVSTYQPLTPQGGVDVTAVRVFNSAGVLAARYNTPGPASHVVWQEPRGVFSVEMIVTIYNNDTFPITITAVGRPDPRASHVRAYFDTYGRAGFRGSAPISPFGIDGHWQQTIALHWRQTCQTGAVNRVDLLQKVPVTISFFGFVHTVRIYAPPFAIRLRSHC